MCVCASLQPTGKYTQDHLLCACPYTGIAVAVSHDEVKGGTGLAPVLIDRAAAVLKHLLAQVRTLLCLFLKQQVPKLHMHTEKLNQVYTDTCTHIYINNYGLYQQSATPTSKLQNIKLRHR